MNLRLQNSCSNSSSFRSDSHTQILRTRRECLNSALYLRLKKRKVFKTVTGDPSGFLKVQFVAKDFKKTEGDTLETF